MYVIHGQGNFFVVTDAGNEAKDACLYSPAIAAKASV